jgi:ABC-type multidrug transport system permease subunit
MKALLLGLIFFAAAFFTGFIWWGDVLAFLRGAVPVIAFFIGLVALFVGAADLKDKAAAKKETDGQET